MVESKSKILIIEDDLDLAEMLNRYFRQEGVDFLLGTSLLPDTVPLFQAYGAQPIPHADSDRSLFWITDYAALVGAASVYFGSWRKAVEAAGYDYARIKRQKEWSKPEIVREIKRMNKEGINLSTTIPVRAKYRNLHAAAIRYFGAWAAAMKAAGLGKLYRRPL